jgi:bifunctional DNA-binding transcriptional regulator/antitoxin component of YhaV-PrlF toxin-antitoxin module
MGKVLTPKLIFAVGNDFVPGRFVLHGKIDTQPVRIIALLFAVVAKACSKESFMTAAVATLSAKFQISIPKTVRERNQWRAGQEFAFLPKGRGVLVMPVAELEDLAGIARGAKTQGVRDRTERF